MNPFDPRCRSFDVFVNLTYWNIACNIFTDVCLGALPIPIIWTLKMRLRVRIYVIAILNLGYFAVVMGILKFIFMLVTAGGPDTTFDYWVHFWQNLQLNIGIIAACASFLKPLLGRLLKLNSTAASYPTYPQYNRSHLTHLSNGYAPGTRKTVISIPDNGPQVQFELQHKNNSLALDRQVSPAHARLQAAAGSRSFSGAGFYKHSPSDTGSDDILLDQPEPTSGIVQTREYTVKYSEV
ncbi:uncharacterized protein DNG_07965 [Cephalotrichum gorgonifer]|uniref:Rhodopsin domain-containing protein n=1 Tax=Cephalotrichum gorgonifer TaxID=2041049 RepID=A0AAE8SY23_9PEZI|nr:uncharacterized protein DNG_07965 [Cephalotrichum gorgonifer]